MKFKNYFCFNQKAVQHFSLKISSLGVYLKFKHDYIQILCLSVPLVNNIRIQCLACPLKFEISIYFQIFRKNFVTFINFIEDHLLHFKIIV